MKKKTHEARYARNKKTRGSDKLVIVLSCIAVALLILVIALICMIPGQAEDDPTLPPETTLPAPTTTAPSTAPSTEPTTLPTETEPAVLEEFVDLHEQNPDFAGWFRIEGTVMDYPVMHTPEDGEKYMYANFDGQFDVNGTLFIKDICSLDPESDNLIIYGHNMLSGAMFGSLMEYAHKYFWEKHPVIEFSTLYEHRKYEVVAAFYDRVYRKTDTCFKFYQFIDARDEEHFQEAMDYYKEHALYDTGVTAEYGDKLITLVTCAYHERYGRFVVVAREMVPENEEIPESTAD